MKRRRPFRSCAAAASLSLLAGPPALSQTPPAVGPQPEAAAAGLPLQAPALHATALHAPEVGPQAARTVAVFMTGDGGWAPFDAGVSADMSRAGVPTIGFDTAVYFSSMRTPEEAAEALGEAVRSALARYDAETVIVVGYSFGADVAPFLVNRLPPDIRRRIDRVALMSLSDEAPFQITLAERLGVDAPGARPVLPELQTLVHDFHVTCLHGEHDSKAICASAGLPAMRQVRLPGGHGFADDHQAVADAILGAWPLSEQDVRS